MNSERRPNRRGATRLLIGALLIASSCGRRPPADSADAAFATSAERVLWMEGRLAIEPPSPMRDAQFRELESEIPGGHMGPGYSMYWLFAKIDIDPQDAGKWAAATKSVSAPRWERDLNPMYGSDAKWSITPAEFDTVTWHDPAPLVGTSAHGGYQGGFVLIPAGGESIYIWQHWR